MKKEMGEGVVEAKRNEFGRRRKVKLFASNSAIPESKRN